MGDDMNGWTVTRDKLGLGIEGMTSDGDEAADVIARAGLIRAFRVMEGNTLIAMGKGCADAARPAMIDALGQTVVVQRWHAISNSWN